MEINSLPMNDDERNKYKRDIANIYQIAFEDGEKLAIEYAEGLKNLIEQNLIIQRKEDLFKPSIFGFLFILAITSIPFSKNYIGDFYHPIFYGSIGGLLSIIIQNNKFDIDYKVDKKLLKFESLKLILVSNIMAIVGFIAINSGIILSNLNTSNSQYFLYLIYILCGYSQTFIPSLLKNFEINNNK
ncbi:hypothetical protein WHY31_12585 [Clostridium perfringens]|uniref:hypothetical protein n=1 Tax=Clostridium perfringens TaxID=1502 RepID=UPI001A2E5168|nr:hypothetical protein [Clostridium perfringens]HAT4221604.1 hypothetical protein [Clostridium perfringens]